MDRREYNGTVTGERARQYSGYVYRTAVIEPLSLRLFDPDRLFYDREYPRDVNRPSSGGGQVTDNLDYTVEIVDDPVTFTSTVALIIRATKYTGFRKDLRLFEFDVKMGLVNDSDIVNEALHRAFD